MRQQILFAFILGAWAILFFELPAQNQIKNPNMLPPSSDAAALGKYVNTPVGSYTIRDRCKPGD